MSYSVAMQIKHGNFAQACLTLIGLGLLVLAIFLNHYHPHNAGIATATHGNIYQLNLDLYQQPKTSSDYVAFAKSISSKPVSVADTNSTPMQPASESVINNQTPVVVTATSSSTTSDNNYCSQLDKSSYAQSIADIAKSQSEYAAAKDSPNDTDHQISASSQPKSHQDYLNAVASAYSNYKQTLINLGCGTAQAAPAASSAAN